MWETHTFTKNADSSRIITTYFRPLSGYSSGYFLRYPKKNAIVLLILSGLSLKRNGKVPSECNGKFSLMRHCPNALSKLVKLNLKCALSFSSSSVTDGCRGCCRSLLRLQAKFLVPLGTVVDLPRREGPGVSASLPHGAARVIQGGADSFSYEILSDHHRVDSASQKIQPPLSHVFLRF